jgi:hypothetical protein
MIDDLRSHGMKSFVFEILEKCDRKDTRNCEQKWLDRYRPFDPQIIYNACEDSRSPRGRKYPDSHKNAISESLTGRDVAIETCVAISEGKKNSVKTKVAMATLNAAKRNLSDDDVRRIRSMNGGATAIAREMGVSRRVIRAILGGETYTEVT